MMLKEKQMVCREKGKASCVMGGMQFLSPTQQCQGAAEALPGLGPPGRSPDRSEEKDQRLTMLCLGEESA